MEKQKIQVYVDEDFFALKKEDYSEEEWKKIVIRWIDFEHYVDKNLFEKGLISKIIWNRFQSGGFRIFNFNRTDLMMPSKFNELFDMKPINAKLFSNAIKEIFEKLKQEVRNSS